MPVITLTFSRIHLIMVTGNKPANERQYKMLPISISDRISILSIEVCKWIKKVK
jgi:hypothetical protein